MAMMIASITGHKPQNNTTSSQRNSHNLQSKIDVTLWLHITLMLSASLFIYPAIFILKKRNHSCLRAFEVIMLTTAPFGTFMAIFQRHRFPSSSQSWLGYSLVVLSTTYLSHSIRCRDSSTPSSKSSKSLEIFQCIIHATFPFLLYVETVLGVIAL